MRRLIAVMIGVLTGTYLGFLYAEMDEPVLITRIDVVSEQVPAGGDLHLKLHIFRLRNDCSYVERRSFIVSDGSQRSYTLEIRRQGQPLGAVIEDRFIQVPAGAPPGHAEFVIDVAFSCGANWLQNWWPTTITARHIYFDIIPPE